MAYNRLTGDDMPFLTEQERQSINNEIETLLQSNVVDLYSSQGTVLRTSGVNCIISALGVQTGVVQSSSSFVQRSEYELTFPYGTILKTFSYTIDAIKFADGTIFIPISVLDSTQAGIRIRAQCIFAGKLNAGGLTTPSPVLLYWMNGTGIKEKDQVGSNDGTYKGTWLDEQQEGFSSVLYPNTVNEANAGRLLAPTDAFALAPPYSILLWAKITTSSDSTFNYLFRDVDIYGAGLVIEELDGTLLVKSNEGAVTPIATTPIEPTIWNAIAVTIASDASVTLYQRSIVDETVNVIAGASAFSDSIGTAIEICSNTTIGSVQNVQVFNDALTQAQIEDLWFRSTYDVLGRILEVETDTLLSLGTDTYLSI